MTRLRSLTLGAKLSVALIIFLAVLGMATAGLILYGFNRTRDNATNTSRKGLEDSGQQRMLIMAQDQAGFGVLQMQWASDVGQLAARNIYDLKRTGADVPSGSPEIVRHERGVFYDPNPERNADIVLPAFASLSDEAMRDIRDGAALDAIAPAVFAGYAGRVRGDNFDAIAFYFASVNHVHRYYPPIGVHEIADPATDITPVLEGVGPIENPERKTRWTPPYEDEAGQGLVLTAYTPVYEDDDFRGVIGIDLSLEKMAEQVDMVAPSPSGFSFYQYEDGDLLRSGAYDLLQQELAANPNGALRDALDAMQRDESGVQRVSLNGAEHFVAFAPMQEVGGSFAVVAPVAEITADAALITGSIDEDAERTLLVTLLGMLALFVGSLFAATILNRRALLKPLHELAAATRSVARGDRAAEVPVERGDELGMLAADFNVMVEQLRESERELEQRVESRTSELNALLLADAELFGSLEIDTVLQRLADVAVELLGADKSIVLLHEGDIDRVRAARNFAPANVAWTNNVLAQMPHEEPDPAEEQPRVMRPEPPTPEGIQEALNRESIAAYVSIPIRDARRMLGAFGIGMLEDRTVEDDELRIYQALADRAAVAIQNADLYEQAQLAASLEERQRLARELHDSVSQALYGIALGTRTARLRLGDDPHNAAEPIDYVASLAQAGLAEMRALIFELRPESLEQEGVVAAIEKQVASISARYKLDIDTELGEEPECSLDTKEALYRIAQEALHNVVKHARASHVAVHLNGSADTITLTIADDGRGFDPNVAYPGHVGLRSMPERAEKLRGSVIIESAPGTGTRVVARLPRL